MTDDLVKRLRAIAVHSYLGRSVIEEAADRIEALTADRENRLADLRIIKAERDRLREELTGIKRAATHRMRNDPNDLHSYYFHTSSAALKGDSHE